MTIIPTRLTRAEVLDMSDADFRAACQRQAWRDPPAQLPAAATTPGLVALVRRHVLEMSGAELAAAIRAKAWNTSLVPMAAGNGNNH